MRNFKSYLTEAKLKAEDYEAAIVMGFHEITGQKLDVERSGIGQKTYEVIEANPAVKEAGVRIAKAVKSHFKLGNSVKSEQYGRAKSSLTSFWKSQGASDTTPKTDILIGDKRLSLKIGLAQLMSGGKAESLATFYAAVNEVGEVIKKDPNYKLTEDVINSFVTNTTASGKIGPLIKSGENEIINKAESAHKSAMKVLGDLFANNREFKIAFAREAMSGFAKYGKDSNSAAEFMLVATHDGSGVSIHSVYDDDYCAKIADNSRLQVRFKTSSRKLKGVKTGEYNFWSVTSLIVNAMTEDVNPRGQSLQEIRLLKKAKTAVVGFVGKILKRIKKTAKSFLTFVIGDAKPTITTKKIKF
jgi:hypothetical protein